MLTKEYLKENICREICDTIDKYGRGWQNKHNACIDMEQALGYLSDADMIDIDQENTLLTSFINFITIIDNVFNEIK